MYVCKKKEEAKSSVSINSEQRKRLFHISDQLLTRQEGQLKKLWGQWFIYIYIYIYIFHIRLVWSHLVRDEKQFIVFQTDCGKSNR